MRIGIPKGFSLKGQDAIHLATAKRLGVEAFHTYDGGLTKWGEVIGVPVAEPDPEQPRLIP
jgi:predicted nucleic acid-binding protein